VIAIAALLALLARWPEDVRGPGLTARCAKMALMAWLIWNWQALSAWVSRLGLYRRRTVRDCRCHAQDQADDLGAGFAGDDRVRGPFGFAHGISLAGGRFVSLTDMSATLRK